MGQSQELLNRVAQTLSTRGLVFSDIDTYEMPLGPREWSGMAVATLTDVGWNLEEEWYDDTDWYGVMKQGTVYVTLFYRSHSDQRTFAGVESA